MLNPTNDVAFTRLFGTAANAELTLTLLNHSLQSHLTSPLVEVVFLAPGQLPRDDSDPSIRLDMRCKDAQGNLFIVQMQVGKDQHFSQRAQYYALQAFFTSLKERQPDEKLTAVLFLGFANFNLFPDKKHYKSNHVFLDQKTHENDLDHLRFTFVDLVACKQQNAHKSLAARSQEEKLYTLLNEADKLDPSQLEQLTHHDPIMQRLQQQLTPSHWSQEALARYEAAAQRQRNEPL